MQQDPHDQKPPDQEPPPGGPPPAGGLPPTYAGPPIAYPPPGMPGSQDERTWAMLCHLAAFSGFIVAGVGAVVGPLVVWLIKRETYPLVDDQGKEALNFNITVLLAGIACFILVFVIIGIFLLLALAVYWVVMTIIAAVQANKGIAYRYPLTLRLVT